MDKNTRFIPVGYSEIPAQELQVNDVIHAQGKVSKVYVTQENELFELENGDLIALPAVVYEIPSVLEGSFIERHVPINFELRVLFYSQVTTI